VKPAYILAFFILVGSMIFALFSFSQGIAPYVPIAQARANPDAVHQVKGKIVKESVRYDMSRGELRFDVIDKNNDRMTVVYNQSKPDSFDTATQVDAIGKFQGGVFRAHTLLVKCPSKYTDEKKAQ
jgi:cytochrome c-type biogenesis protein CcmE